jgi:hypothetical protein
MGMFDYIRCKMPLPVPRPPEGTEFQTKDVPTAIFRLDMWEITEDGRLLRIEHRWWLPVDSPDSSLEQAIDTDDEISHEIVFTGDISFCTGTREGEWWEYTARFKDGRCTKITLTEYLAPGEDWRNAQKFPLDEP